MNSGLVSFIKMFNNELNVIKRGSRIVFLQYRNIAFVDAMTFGPGCSLDDFGKMWGAPIKKGCFPYEKYTTIEQLVTDRNWPALDDFNSRLTRKMHEYTSAQVVEKIKSYQQGISIDQNEIYHKIMSAGITKLKSPVDLDVYLQMWQIFETGKREGKMTNMMDFLCYYNAVDTEVLTEAMQKYISSFIANFKTCPNEFITLPAIAETILWNHYDASEYLPYSFNEEFADLSNLIRSQLAGGLSCVFTRHVEVGQQEMVFDPQVYLATNGDRFQQLIAFDVNSKFFNITTMSKNTFG